MTKIGNTFNWEIGGGGKGWKTALLNLHLQFSWAERLKSSQKKQSNKKDTPVCSFKKEG